MTDKNAERLLYNINMSRTICGILVSDLCDLHEYLKKNPNKLHYSEFGRVKHQIMSFSAGEFNECNESNIKDYINVLIKLQKLAYENKEDTIIKIHLNIRVKEKNKNRDVGHITTKDKIESKGDVNFIPKDLLEFVTKREYTDSSEIIVNDIDENGYYIIKIVFFSNLIFGEKHITETLSWVRDAYSIF